jgi:hypothetical protein
VLRRFLVKTEGHAYGAGDDRGQTFVVELAIGVCAGLSHVGSNLTP